MSGDAADGLSGPQEGIAADEVRTERPGIEALPVPETEAPEDAPDRGLAPDGSPWLNSGISAKQASLRGVAARQAKRALQEASAPGDLVRHVRVPVNVSATVRKLAKEAQRGSTHASRELRAWMDVLEADTPSSVSELDARTRQRLLTRLLVEIEQSE